MSMTRKGILDSSAMSTGSEDRFPLTVGEDTGDAIDVSLSPETAPG